jgi:hypothetical protein
MNTVLINPKFNESDRRDSLFNGDFIIYTRRESLEAITNYAHSLIVQFFGNDAENAQFSMAVEDFVKIAAALKTEFTNSIKTTELISN